MSSKPRLSTIRELARQVRSLEKSPPPVGGPGECCAPQAAGSADLFTEWLPMECGVIEWLAEGPGSGAAAIALALTGRVASRSGAVVVVDPQREFYPPGAAAIGFDLSQLVVVRPPDQAGALWAFEQALRCRGVQTALLRRGPLDDYASRRLQLAVEQGGGVGLLIRPACFRRQTSWADVRLLVKPVAGGVAMEVSGFTRRLRIEVLFRRGAIAGGAINVEFCHETGDVRLVPELGSATRVVRAVGA